MVTMLSCVILSCVVAKIIIGYTPSTRDGCQKLTV